MLFQQARRPMVYMVAVLSLMVIAVSSGCGLLANFINAAGGGLIPPAYDGLKEQRVAVVCISSAQFGPPTISNELSRRVARNLKANVNKIELIDPLRVEDWIDRNGWDYIDHKTLGRGVEADMLVVIDLDSFNYRQGGTLYQGQADIRAVVYDMASGDQVFAYTPPQIRFPTTAIPSTGTNELQFRRQFLDIVGERISRNFYPYDAQQDFARDASVMMQ